jgi:lysophospholipase L1-like esterase
MAFRGRARSNRRRAIRVWALATLALLAVAACTAAASAPPTGSRSAAPSPSTVATDDPPSSTPPATTLGAADVGRPLAEGVYRIGAPFEVPFLISLPAGSEVMALSRGDIAVGTGGGWIQVDLVENVFADPCDSMAGPIDPPVASTVDGVASALMTMVSFKPGPVTDVVIGAATGTAFDLVNTISTDRTVCYGVQMLPMWTFRGGGNAATNGGAHERIWVLDVSGTVVVVDRGGTGIDAVAESLRFEEPVAPEPVAATPAPTPREPRLRYVALGDSILFAAEGDCDRCESAAVIYGAQASADLGRPVDVFNLTMHNSLTTPRLLEYLTRGARTGRPEADLFDALAGADIVSVTIGFNDLPGPVPLNNEPLMDAYDAQLEAILDRIEKLRDGKPTLLLLTQIYNNGGPFWTSTVEAQNEVICRVAKRHDAVCVDVYRAFNGADGTASPAALGYLAADDTHPSQLGQEAIAATLNAAGYGPLE